MRVAHSAESFLSTDAASGPESRSRAHPWLGRLLRGLAALVVVAATLEVSARIVLSRDVLSERVRGMSDAAWRLDWIERHKGGVEVYYSFDVFHQTRGWALKPDLRDADPYGPGSLNSNSAGVRGVREFGGRPPAGVTRIVLIGDSFAFGEEVADHETFAHRLEELLPRTEVLNLGVHGYGHDQMLIYLREGGLSYHPDIVIVGFVQDDMQRNMLSFRDYAKPRFELADGKLSLRNSPVPAPDEVMSRERYRSRFVDLVEMVEQAALWRSGVNQRRMEALTAALLDEITAESTAAGATTAFFYLPHSEELTNPELTLDAERFFTGYCEERDALCLNLRPTFLERMSEGYPVKTPGHWHGSGHQLVAEALAAFLAERGLVPS